MWQQNSLFLLFGVLQAYAFSIPSNDFQLTYSLSEIVEKVNSNSSLLWKADYNFHPDTPASYLKTLTGVLPFDESIPELAEFIEEIKQNKRAYAQGTENHVFGSEEDDEDSSEEDIGSMGCKNAKGLPRNFDSRKQWPQCKSIKHIVDQSKCGSCWAVSVATAISDRLCIASNGFFQGQISSEQILTCTPNCNGCGGGWPQLAWKMYGHAGVVSGGDYNSTEGCQPYPFPPCEHYTTGPLNNCTTLGKLIASKCRHECFNPLFEASYSFDVKKGKKAHTLPRCNIMRHMYQHGPVVAIFAVYEDFLQYKSGVYQHSFGKIVGLHAVRVLGWGIENDTPYWLIANSWNDHWGDNGTFKILRGENELDIEMMMNAGYPDFVKV